MEGVSYKIALTVVLLSHWVADWVLQPPKMGREKSSKLSVLAAHISIIFLVPFATMMFFFPPIESAILSLINALVHAVIDWNIWRFYRVTVYFRHRKEVKEKGHEETVKRLQKEWKYWLDPVFGWFLGFDQILHVIVIIWIY